jgi:hypothetical protein
MNPTNIRTVWCALTLGCLTLAGNSVGESVVAAEANHSAWTISAAPSIRQFRKVSFDTASGLKASSQQLFRDRAQVGAADRYDNRTYDDGFVNVDAFTEGDGYTWNWGYDKATQVEGGKLNFHAMDSQRAYAEISGASDSWSDTDEMEAGVRLAAERAILQRGRLSASLLCGVDYARVSADKTIQGTWTMRHEDTRIVDGYDLEGDVPPPAPYAGDFFASGLLIGNIPTTRGTQVDNPLVSRDTLTVTDSLDADVFTMSLGLAVRGHFGKLRIGGAAGPSLSLISLNADHAEICKAASWNSQISESDLAWEPGVFGQADVDLAMCKRAGLRFTGRYDWINSTDGMVGPSRYTVDVSGFSVSCGVYVDL